MTILANKRPALTPKEFRELTGWSLKKISRETEIPLFTLYGYFKEPGDAHYREPKPFVNRLFGELYTHYCKVR